VYECRLDPGVPLITKPFTYAALALRLREILDMQTAPAVILVIEDEVLIQMLAAEYLEELGFKTEVAGSAAAARSKLALLKGEVAAVVVDLGLPDASGDDLVRELRGIYPELPILIASGESRASLLERFKNYERVGVLGKPYTIAQLESALRSIGVLQ
jgi:DNA-binding response OmpR family regulator